MTAKLWRQRAVYVVMSAFLAWHSFAILVGPAPTDSDGYSPLDFLLHPYLTLLGLDNRWDFFAPGIDTGYKIRYMLEGADGASHAFTLEAEPSWYRPSVFWFTEWRDAIVDDPEVNAPVAAALLCREHAALRPITVILVKVEQKEFWPADYLRGKRPFDPDFVTEQTIKRLPCPAP